MKSAIHAAVFYLVFISLSIPLLSQTPDFFAQQAYLYDPPYGLGIWNVRHLPGAKGENIKIIDVEQRWNLNHEDLPSGIQLTYGVMNPSPTIEHGTAVLGILVAKENGIGVEGICPLADVDVVSRYDDQEAITQEDEDEIVAAAVKAARLQLEAGDILLLEVYKQIIEDRLSAPIEYLEKTKTEIVEAINDGIIVIEAAGNTGNDIANYHGSTGAIIVAGGNPESLTRHSASNYGDRIDVHAWGDNVTTCGYGDDYSGSPSPNDDYTFDFDGTSSASAIVAGAVAVIQGINYAATGEKLAPAEMRSLLKNNGTPHQSGNENIGVRPNIPKTINALGLNNISFVEAELDQVAQDNTSFGEIEYFNAARYVVQEVPVNIYFQESTNGVIKASQEQKSGTSEKYQDWDIDNNIENHRELSIVQGMQKTTARFEEAVEATLQTALTSAGGINGDDIDFKDPWLVDFDEPPYGLRNRGMSAPFLTYGTPFNLTTASSFLGVFLNQEPDPFVPEFPYYSIRAPFYKEIEVGGENIAWYFDRWETVNATITTPDNYVSGYYETPVVFNSDGAIVTALYKGHLRTAEASLGDAQNQRRLLMNGNFWNMVYEDGGDIWFTHSSDAGLTWAPEVRLNFNRGTAKNPTFSNVFDFDNPGSSDFFVVAWVEENWQQQPYLHLQTMKGWGVFFGWGAYSDDDRDVSHIEYGLARDGARPSLSFHQSGNNAWLTFAYEIPSGIEGSGYVFPGNGQNNLNDFNGAIPYIPLPISYNSDAFCPVVLYKPQVYTTANTFIYFIDVQSPSSSQIVQYTWETAQTQILTTPQDYHYFLSLQGVVSEDNGMIGLIAEAHKLTGLPGVVYYKRYPYGPTPQINTTLTAFEKPTIMAENSAGFGTLTSEVMSRSVSNSDWYRWPGSGSPVYIGDNATGIYSRQTVPSGDRDVIITSIASNPTKLEKYNGTGTFNKIGDIPIDIKTYAFWKDQTGSQQIVEMDYTGTNVEVIDSLQGGDCVSAVKFQDLPSNGIIVNQVSALTTPLTANLLRGGFSVWSSAPFLWQQLTTSGIPGIQSGDILKFSLQSQVDSLHVYTEITMRDNGLSAGSLPKENSPDFSLTETSVQAYPNPFNPATTLRVSIDSPQEMKLVIYNLLGEVVTEIYDGYLEVGIYEFPFDGRNFASGIYFYRFMGQNRIQTGRLLLTK